MPREVHVVILAAGKGTRMKSARPKVLHSVAGMPMIEHVLETAAALNPATTTVVIGHCAEVLKSSLARHAALRFVVQEPQLGTAHALLQTEPVLKGHSGTVVLLSGDVPLLSSGTLTALIEKHGSANAGATVVTAVLNDASGYGRIVRGADGRMERIVEHRDASAAEREIREINSGIYAFDLDGLFDSVRGIAAINAQKEYYLPDLIGIYRSKGRCVETISVANADEIRGINSRMDLAEVGRLAREAKNLELMASGVTIEDPSTTYIDRHVEVAPDTVIHPNVSLEGRTRIGEACEIHSGVRVANSHIGNRVTVLDHCVVTQSVLEDNVSIGPFAHLRNDASVGAKAKVGNFVEMKKTRLGPGSKAMHLAYLGDAVIGTGVNIGAGTITCNYDGVHKHTTTIEDGAFIGSDSQLIAPVTVGREAYVGTGTTVREDVPSGSLAVSAGKQRNIEGWVEKKNKRKA